MDTDINLKGSDHDKPSPENSATLFVSLYVVVLAFFILLASHAQFDMEKARNVVNSVNKAFSIEVTSETDMKVASLGNELSVTQFFKEMQKSLQSIVPLEEMKVITDGQKMIMTMPATALFNRDDPNLRHDRRHFYDRLSNTMRKWRDGMKINLTMLQGVEKPVGMGADAASTLEITRAGNFARFMENRGAAPRNIAVAIEQGNAGTITLVFDVLAIVGGKLNLPDKPEPEPEQPSAPIPLQSVGGAR